VRWALVAAVALALLGGGALLAWRVGFRDSATPAEVGAAVSRFRGTTTSPPRGGLPAPGVYVYATSGYERIDALGGVRHAYPSRSTLTALPTSCGMRLRWDVLTSRSTAWDYCADARGLVRTGSAEVHRFYGRTERTTYACRRGWLLVPSRPRAGESWPIACTGSDGSRERGRGSVAGFETLRVGGTSVTTVHIRERSTLEGHITGTSAEDVWLRSSDRLPVRLVTTSRTSNPSLVGDVHYVEQATLTLVSLAPRR